MLPTASISVDLDDLWTYLKVQGDARWEARPSYLPVLVPRLLDFLDAHRLRVTVFIVGADAARPEARDYLQEIVRRGHEVGNHSYEHESWLHTYTPAALADEVQRAEDAIASATGQRPRGFRGPGYSWSPALLEVLAARGYRYDASTLPTFIGPLARWYYFRTARLSSAERRKRQYLFGRFRDGFRPLRPYHFDLGNGRRVLEIPVTTIPFLRTPFHPSYLLYLSRLSSTLMHAYLGTALRLCRATGVQPSLLLHPLDLLGADDVRDLAFFPGMDLTGERKRQLLGDVLAAAARRFTLRPMSEHADQLETRSLPRRLVAPVA